MRAKTIAAVLASAAISVLCLPGGAVAGGGGGMIQIISSGNGPSSRGGKPKLTQTAELRGTRGYKVTFTLVDRAHLVVSTSNRGKSATGASLAAYSLRSPQQGEADTIKARIGHLGRIDVRFVPESVARKPPPSSCHGRDSTLETGHYVGFISFRGEHGYTRVRARRAEGTISREPPRVCRRQRPRKPDRDVKNDEAESVEEIESEEPESDEVQLNGSVRPGPIFFRASRQTIDFGDQKTVTNFLAAGSRSRGRIHLFSLVLIFAGRGSTFLTPDPLHPTDEAILKPAAPFSGSATFRHEPGQEASWKGSLRVELPGFGTVPLAGRAAHASMCEASTCQATSVFSLPGTPVVPLKLP